MAHAQAGGQDADGDTPTDVMMSANPPLAGSVTVGGLFPLTGDFGTFGLQMRAAMELAVADFNAYLAEGGAEWRLEMAIRDTATDPDVALEEIRRMHESGMTVITGPMTSASVDAIRGYADDNGMLIVACCSTAPSLAIAGDSVYRLAADDSGQGVALARLIDAGGKDAIVPIWRGDAYGDGLWDAVSGEFEDLGGHAYAGVRYTPDSVGFASEVARLDGEVHAAVNAHGADKVAVLMISFDESAQIVREASLLGNLSGAEWFVSETAVDAAPFTEDEAANAFANAMNFTATQYLFRPGDQHGRVNDMLAETLGSRPVPYVNAAYDTIWAMGRAIEHAGSANATDIGAQLPGVVAGHQGATIFTELNEAGDLAYADYRILAIDGDAWREAGTYLTQRGMIIPAAQPSGEVRIGALYPVTGSTKGQDNLDATRLGAEDFNGFLDSVGIGWRLSVVGGDTVSNPFSALAEATRMHQSGIDVIIGPELSINVERVGRYASENGMVLLSCCSTAPSLAVPGDGIFRLIPDDSQQGIALAKLLQSRGIQAIVPIWRGDVYGDGLRDATASSFASRGGVVGEGIRYGLAETEFADEAEMLAIQVRSMAEEYGADSVAVLMISFGEGRSIALESAAHDILTGVRWFGSETLAKSPLLTDETLAELSNTIEFAALQVADNPGPLYERVHMHISEIAGREPTSHVYRSYDAAWLVGLSILQSGTADADALKATLPDVAMSYSGAQLGTILNEAGDIASADYAVWQIVDGEWVQTGTYSPLDDTITVQ
jgi:branched-chain amino acid transport system substrate-binding protein